MSFITYQVVAEVKVPLFQRYSLELHPILQLVLEYLPHKVVNEEPSKHMREAGAADEKNVVYYCILAVRMGALDIRNVPSSAGKRERLYHQNIN